MHPTGGSLRVFKQFARLEAGSVKTTPSRPAHQRVPITALVKCEDKTPVAALNRSYKESGRSRLFSWGRFFVLEDDCFSFSGNASPSPTALFFVPGFHDLLLVDPNNY